MALTISTRWRIRMLREFGFPVTLYLSTFYCRYQAPVFDVACVYMLWKASAGHSTRPGFCLAGGEVAHYRSRRSGGVYRRASCVTCGRNIFPAAEKDELLNVLAARLGVDLAGMRKRRMLHYMTPEEVREVSRSGVDIQLHTHRHRMPRDRGLFAREIEDNVREIQEMTGSDGQAFALLLSLRRLRSAVLRLATGLGRGVRRRRANRVSPPAVAILTSYRACWICPRYRAGV